MSSKISEIVKFLVHILPIAVLLAGRPYLAVAALLFVICAYVKVKKLSLTISESKAKTKEIDPSLLKARARWLALTYLKPGVDQD
ncbi:MAG: hypothetical protein HRU19_11020 [Pseudobacteriovorax sp.]|nr:hypothetical protein [Pseudobacteriovorax sp.]